MYFRDVIGQEEVKKRLIRSAQTGVVPHAQLFTEQGGAGAFPLAIAYGRYLNCSHRTEEDACGVCPSCVKYDALAHPDLHFVFPIVSKKEKKKEVCDDYLPEWRDFLKGRPYFTIDHWLEHMDAGNSQAIIYSKESDEIIRKLSLKIYEAEYRILLVWLPEKLHQTCANKLLKIIEEPPANTIILMVSEAPDLILGTIQSRSQRIPIRPIATESIEKALLSQYKLEVKDAQDVAHRASGSYVQAMEAISLGDENAFFLEQFKGMMRNSWTRNVKGMKAMGDVLAGIGRERQKNFLVYCQYLIRENFMYRFQSPDITYMNMEEKSFSNNFAPYVNERNVFDLMDELAKAERHIAQNVNAKMVFFDLGLRITVLIKR
ncbi:DNA polymerase III subunit delta [Parabacteroides sp. 52]|uniref:DNA polymerase III subunit n=1 Tax=unclassified Parabacteroides TaxID=2649774 RepID=UPI0013D3D500|nr:MULTISPECIES: DNA polymerase III subunit delta [unclassified Parabacteroides]MDH6534625.1 DNA polymerase-3 subunit delta' [Parabacteroides sp. PM5-20]NDV55143.1 DNA polymerase III subunit delta [Parabacteroides sp. 52]